MELYLQFGYGMMEHCRFLVRQWGNGTVVLSPRDLNTDQLERLGSEVKALNGQVLLDPQIYTPAQTNHVRMVAQPYWPESGGFPVEAELHRSMEALIELNHRIGARKIILPGPLASRIDDDWLAIQREVIEEMERCDLGGMMPMLTVAISHDAMRNDEQVQTLLDAVRTWNVPSIYLVCEHPNDDYLVTDAGWLANCADVVAGMRLTGKEVVVGYCNHQMLMLACSAASAISSGTWMNVRCFNGNKFTQQEDDEIKQRSIWYYAPHLLSEFKVTFLELAHKTGRLDLLRTDEAFGSNHADELFTALQPSLAAFTEQQAFRHYLQCLMAQVAAATSQSFDETVDAQLKLLDAAESQLETLHAAGVRGQKRDFYDCIDVNRGAIAYLQSKRAPILRRRWDELTQG